MITNLFILVPYFCKFPTARPLSRSNQKPTGFVCEKGTQRSGSIQRFNSLPSEVPRTRSQVPKITQVYYVPTYSK